MKNSTRRTGEPEEVAVHTTEEPLNTAPSAIFVEILLGDVSFVNQALTWELGVIPLLNAWDFTREVAVRAKGAIY
jgi:hypothetical protein